MRAAVVGAVQRVTEVRVGRSGRPAWLVGVPAAGMQVRVAVAFAGVAAVAFGFPRLLGIGWNAVLAVFPKGWPFGVSQDVWRAFGRDPVQINNWLVYVGVACLLGFGIGCLRRLVLGFVRVCPDRFEVWWWFAVDGVVGGVAGLAVAVAVAVVVPLSVPPSIFLVLGGLMVLERCAAGLGVGGRHAVPDSRPALFRRSAVAGRKELLPVESSAPANSGEETS